MTARDWVTTGIGVVTGFCAAVAFVWMNFVTIEASEQKWQAHNQQIKCNKVSDYRVLVERLKWELDNLPLSDNERNAKLRDLKVYQEEIDKLDPTREC